MNVYGLMQIMSQHLLVWTKYDINYYCQHSFCGTNFDMLFVVSVNTHNTFNPWTTMQRIIMLLLTCTNWFVLVGVKLNWVHTNNIVIDIIRVIHLDIIEIHRPMIIIIDIYTIRKSWNRNQFYRQNIISCYSD